MSELDPTSDKHDGPSRRSAEPYWKRAAPDTRYLRRYFTRRAMLDTVRELVWLAPLTAIIWIYAEREQITVPTKIETSINISSSDRLRFVQPDMVPLRVVLTLKGPQIGVEKVREQLTTSVPRGVPIDIGDELPAGPHQSLDVVSRIQELPVFKINGVTVSESQPAQVSVTIDTIEDREVDVTVPTNVDKLVTAATFEPRKVHLRGPKSVLNQLVDQGNLKVNADITLEMLASPGKKDLPSVPLTPSQLDSGLTVEPPSVHATFDVRAADVTKTIDSVPIVVEALPNFLHANEVSPVNSTMANVRVTGPPDKVQQLVDHHLPARAVVDVDASGQTKLKFELPDAVRPAPGETDRPVEMNIRHRDTGG